MKKFKIEVDDNLNRLLEDNAKRENISVERFIGEILARFVFEPHMMDSEEIMNGYIESGDVNLDWANL